MPSEVSAFHCDECMQVYTAFVIASRCEQLHDYFAEVMSLLGTGMLIRLLDTDSQKFDVKDVAIISSIDMRPNPEGGVCIDINFHLLIVALLEGDEPERFDDDRDSIHLHGPINEIEADLISAVSSNVGVPHDFRLLTQSEKGWVTDWLLEQLPKNMGNLSGIVSNTLLYANPSKEKETAA